MPAPRLLVIADAHVGTPPPESEPTLIDFLEVAHELGDALVVAGDLFEFWFGYRRAIPARAFPVASALERLSRRMPVAMVGGNHDRWGRPFWAEQAGIRWAPHELRAEVAGRHVLAIHGDGLVEHAGRARWTHRLVGHSFTSRAFALVHPDLGLALVERLRPLLSSESARSEAEMQRRAAAQRRWAEERLREDRSSDLLVMGHTHVAASLEVEPGRWYVNPGAWFDGSRYAVVTGDGVALRQFSRAERPPRPTDAPR